MSRLQEHRQRHARTSAAIRNIGIDRIGWAGLWLGNELGGVRGFEGTPFAGVGASDATQSKQGCSYGDVCPDDGQFPSLTVTPENERRRHASDAMSPAVLIVV
ncbi:unnamed protein product [Heligmosomoides polygyrus]|uniref:Transposase n=1 Tax=Heligmosomoides polygyrus TaxID=6339 RepID=A0A183F2R6_HELPZ|nr:unnamed protein product [Heligmosomoides polygyrus]